jgi:long-chain acyl-CoA synthetase
LSSGSTGTPKIIGEIIPLDKWIFYQSRVFKITNEETFFIGGSLAYSANLNIALHILNIGGSLVFPVSNFHRSWIKDIEKNKVSGVFLVPAHFRMLNKVLPYPLKGIKVLISGGEKMDLKILGKIKVNFPGSLFFEFYGSSELGYLTYAAMEDIEKKPRSVGKAFREFC